MEVGWPENRSGGVLRSCGSLVARLKTCLLALLWKNRGTLNVLFFFFFGEQAEGGTVGIVFAKASHNNCTIVVFCGKIGIGGEEQVEVSDQPAAVVNAY